MGGGKKVASRRPRGLGVGSLAFVTISITLAMACFQNDNSSSRGCAQDNNYDAGCLWTCQCAPGESEPCSGACIGIATCFEGYWDMSQCACPDSGGPKTCSDYGGDCVLGNSCPYDPPTVPVSGLFLCGLGGELCCVPVGHATDAGLEASSEGGLLDAALEASPDANQDANEDGSADAPTDSPDSAAD
jgi:hypothetical protein